MDDISVRLTEIIQKYPMVLEDDKKLKSILKDYFPEDRRIQNQLFMVVDTGILNDMKGVKEIKKFKMLGYIHSLVADYGISEPTAKNVIMIWTKAIGASAEDVAVEETQYLRTPNRQGNVIDYSDITTDDLILSGKVIRFTGVGARVIPNVQLQKGTYVVKMSTRMIVNYYDCKKRFDRITIGDSEIVWKPSSGIDFSKPGMVEVKNTDESWVIEFFPV